MSVQTKSIWQGSLRLPESVKAVVRQAAQAEGISMNRWMVRAFERGVAQAEPVRTSGKAEPPVTP